MSRGDVTFSIAQWVPGFVTSGIDSQCGAALAGERQDLYDDSCLHTGFVLE